MQTDLSVPCWHMDNLFSYGTAQILNISTIDCVLSNLLIKQS